MNQYNVEEQVYLDRELRDCGLQPMQTRDLGDAPAETAKEAALRAAANFRRRTVADYGLERGNVLYALIIARGHGEYIEAKAEIGDEEQAHAA